MDIPIQYETTKNYMPLHVYMDEEKLNELLSSFYGKKCEIKLDEFKKTTLDLMNVTMDFHMNLVYLNLLIASYLNVYHVMLGNKYCNEYTHLYIRDMKDKNAVPQLRFSSTGKFIETVIEKGSSTYYVCISKDAGEFIIKTGSDQYITSLSKIIYDADLKTSNPEGVIEKMIFFLFNLILRPFPVTKDNMKVVDIISKYNNTKSDVINKLLSILSKKIKNKNVDTYWYQHQMFELALGDELHKYNKYFKGIYI